MKTERGFTLVELLVVITIIAILSVVGMAVYSTTLKSARDAKRQKDLYAISQALEQYKASKKRYPAPSGCNNIWSDQADWNIATCGLVGFISEMPKDPQNSDLHRYHYCSDGTYFVLGVNMEGSSNHPNDVNCPLVEPNRFYIKNQQ